MHISIPHQIFLIHLFMLDSWFPVLPTELLFNYIVNYFDALIVSDLSSGPPASHLSVFGHIPIFEQFPTFSHNKLFWAHLVLSVSALECESWFL